MNKDEPLYNDQSIITIKKKKEKTGLLPNGGCNSINDKIMANKLLSSFGESNPFFTFREFEELLSSFGSISRKPSLRKLYLYFLKNRAATWQVLLKELKVPESSLARGLKELLNLGFIEQVTQFQAKRLGGTQTQGVRRHRMQARGVCRGNTEAHEDNDARLLPGIEPSSACPRRVHGTT